SRTSGCITPKRCAHGSRVTRRTSTRFARCSTRRSCARGGSISWARSWRSSTASCSCSRCCSRGPARTRCRGRVRTSTSAVDEVSAYAGAASYERKKAQLAERWSDGGGQLQLAKSTISNLFRYQPRETAAKRISLGEFSEVIGLDADARTLDVEGLATFETVAGFALERGFVPLVVPELKHITVGGATVGIGIESTCFRNGFVH